jgi:hypothetical protein
MTSIRLPASYYQQFDADIQLDVPGEGYGGWRQEDVEISAENTAVVVMHAWDSGTPADFPGWYRAVEYIPRAQAIASSVLPPLLAAVRSSRLPLFHVVGGGDYYKDLPGYRHAAELAGPGPEPVERVPTDPHLAALQAFRSKHVFVGEGNREDVDRGFTRLDFMPQARPQDDEGVAENAPQLLALCREAGVNHLIYAGFAINWCLLLSPGGMADMSKHGVLCSALRQAVTAVENRETAREQLCKEIGLWRVALAFGFVFDVDPFVNAIVAS